MANVLGWKRQPFDPRDRKFVPPKAIVANLPPSFDLTPSMGPMLDQEDLGSCGPNTVAECVSFDQKIEGLTVQTLSRLAFYYAVRQLMGTTGEDSGVDNRTMLKAAAQFGFAPETMWPYQTSRFTVKPPQAVWNAALPNKITDYAAVNKSLDQMKGTIASGRPFVFGFDVFNQIMSNQAAANGILSNPSGSVIGGHDVTLCAFTDKDLPGVQPGNIFPAGTFKFRNHWANGSQPWGDGGYGYISYDYAAGSHADDFWVINTIPGGLPTPPTPTPPDPTPIPPGPTPTPPGPSIAGLPKNFALSELAKNWRKDVNGQWIADIEGTMRIMSAYSGGPSFDRDAVKADLRQLKAHLMALNFGALKDDLNRLEVDILGSDPTPD